MKTRVISSLVGIAILAVVLCFYETFVFVVGISFISVIAVYELLHSTKLVTNKFVLAWSMIFAAFLPAFFTVRSKELGLPISALFVAGLCIALLRWHETLSVTGFCAAFTFTILVPSSFSVLILLREMYPTMGLFYLFLVLLGAWGSDVGAYFAGRAFGKHKLCPTISPNKTIEGFVGGVISAVICYLVLGLIFTYLTPILYPGVGMTVNYLELLVIAPFCSATGVLGDLFASVIKRQTGIKDYGNIMPGHGGVMDRFDSVLFVSPVLFVLVQLLPPAVVYMI